MESIMQEGKFCYLCGRKDGLEKHHVFFGYPGRRLSDENGLWVWLCYECHRTGKHSAHLDYETNKNLKKDGQRAFELTHTRKEFMDIFGRNWL